jgi:hypothetical protein
VGAIDPAQAKQLRDGIADVIVKSKKHTVFIVDFRKCDLLPADVELMIIGMMRGINPGIERTGMVFDPATKVSAQMDRAIALARNPMRRGFGRSKDCIAWLGEILTPQEVARANQFIVEGD